MSTFVRQLGLELETEGIGTSHWPSSKYWAYVDEGSLRGRHTEFVLSKPLKGKDLIEAISEVSSFIGSDGVEISDRCSLHVHVDVRDLSREQILAVCLLYTIFERPLYRMSGDRYFNKYCVPVAESNYIQNGIAKISSGNVVSSSNRYGGLNLNALSKFGSLEFRMHSGTKKRNELLLWCKVLHDLVEEGKKNSPEDVIRLASEDVHFLSRLIFNGRLSLEGSISNINYSIKVAETIYLISKR